MLYIIWPKQRNVFQRNKSRNPECASGDYPARSRNELLNRAIFAWPWNENARTKQNSRKRFDWFIERIRTGVGSGWLLENYHIWDNESTDTSLLRHTATQLANRTMPFSYWGFLLRNNEEAMFWSFHSLADKRNKEHLPKPFFKVIKKSVYMGANFLVKSKSGSLIRKWIFHFFPKIQKRIIDPNDPQRRWLLWIISKTGYLRYMIRSVSLLRIRKEWIQPQAGNSKQF